MRAYFLAMVIALGLFGGTVGPFIPGPDGPIVKPLDQHGTE